MEGKLLGAASTTPSSCIVCCMCGDHGLLQELFRCKSCHVRHQHKYCSNLYPRTEKYRTCNWCLSKELGGKGLEQNQTSNLVELMQSNNSTNCNSMGLELRLQQGAFASDINRPIKKPKLPERPPSGLIVKTGSATRLSSGMVRPKQVFRSKVRRYKLLEEVSS